ncbi:hypothetical protein F8388_020156 [Cannabis sativa]|uniref:Uncharacterized protein n=1 Tax=Cannabis sativa TaxID=3483 RepID=A0A7J6FLF2_CANSA|nr:hypothetical protein F8388_020156 [Cannabis sativa]
MGNTEKLLNQIMELKFTAKSLQRQARKCEKEEESEKLKIKKAMEKGNIDGTRIYTENAILRKIENLLTKLTKLRWTNDETRKRAALEFKVDEMRAETKWAPEFREREIGARVLMNEYRQSLKIDFFLKFSIQQPAIDQSKIENTNSSRNNRWLGRVLVLGSSWLERVRGQIRRSEAGASEVSTASGPEDLKLEELITSYRDKQC